jgi:uncharacterized membrane protein
MGSLPWAAAGVVAAGIIHILCVFAIPILAGQDAWGRLAAVMKPNTLAISDGKNAPKLPFTSPEVAAAYCLFDISKDNVIVKSPLAEPSWSLAVSARSGENFYLVTGADTKQPRVRLLIVPQSRLSEEESTEKTDEGEEQNIIVSPSDTGIIAIRAPLRGESFRAVTQEELKQARCEIQKRQEPVVAVVEPSVAPQAQPGPSQRRRRR